MAVEELEVQCGSCRCQAAIRVTQVLRGRRVLGDDEDAPGSGQDAEGRVDRSERCELFLDASERVARQPIGQAFVVDAAEHDWHVREE